MKLEHEIQERREEKQTFRESEAWLAGQREALEAALNGAPLERSLGVLVRTATDRLGQGVRAAFYLANRDGTALHHVVGMSVAYAKAVDGFQISPESLSCGLAMHTGLPVLTTDVAKEPRWASWLWLAQKAEFRGCWSFPIRTAAGKFVGTFAVYWRQPREAAPRDLELAALVTQSAAIIIARHTDADMRREAENSLRESEERLRLFIDHAPVAIAMFDHTMRYMTASRRWLDDYGLTGDVIGRSHYEVFPEIPENWREVHRRGLAGDVLHSDGERFDRADGSVQWVKWDVRPWRAASGEIGGVLIATEEITARKQAEEALRESEERLRLAQLCTNVGIWDWDLRVNRLTWTPELEAIYGLEPGSVRSYDDFRHRVHPDDIATVEAGLDRAIRNHDPLELEFRIIRPSGELRWVSANGSGFYDEEGKPIRVLGNNFDITERKQAEQALRASEERLRLAMGAGEMGAWEIDLHTGDIIWDARQYQIFGRPQDRPPITMDEFYTLVHPDDVDRVKGTAASAELTGRFLEEFRIVRADGAVRWITGLGATLADRDGRPVRMVGVNYDTTERKEAQFRLQRFAEELERQVTARTAELLESEDRLRALATELNLAEQRERKRLATEMHDHLQQMLVLGRLKMGAAKQFAETAPAAAKVMKETDEVLSEALQYTRTLVAELSPPPLREHGLAAGLRWLADYMKKYNMGVSISAPSQEVNLPEDQCTLLFQSVRELLINSSKHAHTGEAAVSMKLDGGRMRIIVSDKGQGFDPAAITAPENAGGLSSKFGLFSIRERMRALGGSFGIESSPNEGTVATLILPLESHNVGKEKTTQNTRCVQDCTAVPLLTVGKDMSDAKIHVLLVDDHAMVRQGLRSMLENYHEIEVVGEASNGEEALVAVKKLRPHVVVMDVNMPKMSGIEATAKIKALNPDIVIVGLSVNGGGENRQAMISAGAALLLTKEAAVERLHQVIGEAVELRT